MFLTNSLWDCQQNGFLPLKDPLESYGDGSPYSLVDQLMKDLPYWKDYEGKEQGLLCW